MHAINMHCGVASIRATAALSFLTLIASPGVATAQLQSWQVEQQSDVFLEPLRLDGSEHEQVFAVDWNGDGRTDLVSYNEEGGVHFLTVYQQDASGRLGAPSSSTLPIAGGPRGRFYIADLDGDSLPEIILPRSADDAAAASAIAVGVQDADGEVSTPLIEVSPVANWDALYFVDVDNDGLAEILAYEDAGATGNLWLLDQTAPLQFSADLRQSSVDRTFGPAPAFGDVDGDGFVDFVPAEPVRYYSAGAAYTYGSTVDIQANSSGQTAAIADVDGDTRNDIVLTNPFTGIAVVYQNSNGSYERLDLEDPLSPSSADRVTVNDVDGDGDQDVLAFSNGSIETIAQTSARSFQELETYVLRVAAPGDIIPTPFQSLSADFNDDGRADIAVPSLSGPGVSYSRFGNYPVADIGVTLQSTYTYNDGGTTVDYVAQVSNAGPETTQSGRLLLSLGETILVEGFDVDCDRYEGASGLYPSSSIRGQAFICPLSPIGPGASQTINIATRAVFETDIRDNPSEPDNFNLVANVEMADQVDEDYANNFATAGEQGRTGNLSSWDVPYDTVFVNEASGQVLIAASRSSTSINGISAESEITFDTLVREDFDIDSPIFQIEHLPGQLGVARVALDLVTNDTAEGSEQASVRIRSDRPFQYDVAVNVRDDLGGISSQGAEPFTTSPSPYREIKQLTLLGEPLTGVASDVTGDGLLDLAFAAGPNDSDRDGYWLEVFAGSASGFPDTSTILLPLNEGATDLEAGDFNNDGRDDLLLATASGLQVYQSDGLGGLTAGQAVAGATSYKIATGDLDGNGTLDVAAIEYSDVDASDPPPDNLQVYLQNDGGVLVLSQSLSVIVGLRPQIAIADINEDGIPEIIAASNGPGDDISVLLQQGDGVFDTILGRELTGPANEFGFFDVRRISIGDLDGDSDLEILPHTTTVAVDLAGNEFVESLDHFLVADGFRYHDVADMNLDGLPDIVYFGTFRLGIELPNILFGQPSGVYRLAQGPDQTDGGVITLSEAEPVRIADFDADGSPDVITTYSEDTFAAEPDSAWIGYNWAPQPELSVSTLDTISTIDSGSGGSVRFQARNLAAVTEDESALAITASSNLAITSVYAAAGTCGMLQADASTAGCILPRLQGAGFVDVIVFFDAVSAGAATIEADLDGRTTDVDAADNSAGYSFTVQAATPPPPPPSPPPPSGGGGGGGGSTGGLFLVLLLLATTASRALRRRNGLA